MADLATQYVNSVKLASAEWDEKEETARQKAIARARDYFGGEQTSYLSARLKEILALDSVSDVNRLFHLNVCDKIVNIVCERLSVTGFASVEDSAGDAPQLAAEDGANGTPSDESGSFAKSVWQTNRLDAEQMNVYRMLRRDGEAFTISDFPEGAPVPRILAQQRYVDVSNGGDGLGCRMVYPAGDDALPADYAEKRFSEELTDEAKPYWTEQQIKSGKRQRKTLYYPDRVEKFALEQGKWLPTQDPKDALVDGAIPWLDKAGKPLGIAVTHFKNQDLRCEIDSSVVSMQNLLNKALIDFAEAEDADAFRELIVRGFTPTTDGLAEKADGSNRLKKGAGTAWGSSKPASETAVDVVQAGDLTRHIDAINAIIRWIAFLKDIPASRIQFTGQVASEGTQKQQDAALLAVVAQLQVVIGDAWEDTMYLCRKLANTFGGQSLDESILLETKWKSADTRSTYLDDPQTWFTAAGVAVSQVGLSFEDYAMMMGVDESILASLSTATGGDAAAKFLDAFSKQNAGQEYETSQERFAAEAMQGGGG